MAYLGYSGSSGRVSGAARGELTCVPTPMNIRPNPISSRIRVLYKDDGRVSVLGPKVRKAVCISACNLYFGSNMLLRRRFLLHAYAVSGVRFQLDESTRYGYGVSFLEVGKQRSCSVMRRCDAPRGFLFSGLTIPSSHWSPGFFGCGIADVSNNHQSLYLCIFV